ncbi:MAG TPA: 1-deoxy-D-xylulose-5-phosphate reductoisomerase, partial [Bacillota bacterium]|nr:1-deoxy-D-xylulose-5-phosphate reductoisomerase [Bacillota bacterium]
AVAQFLSGNIPFTMIAGLCEEAMGASSESEPSSLEEVLEADLKARSYVESRCRSWRSCHS